MFDPTLTFDCHISALTASCISKLAHINRAKYAFNSDLLAILINALAFCKLFYCSAVFPGLPHTQASYQRPSLWPRDTQFTTTKYPLKQLLVSDHSSAALSVCETA